MLLTTKVHINNSYKNFQALGRMCYHRAGISMNASGIGLPKTM